MSYPPKGVSRRDFLHRGAQAAAGAFAAAGLASRGAPAVAAEKKPVKRTRFGFTTYQWGKDWDIPTLIASCKTAKVFGLEMRTSQSYAHSVELALSARKRGEVKKQFEDSPITLVGLASSERFDSPDPVKLKAAIEAAKAHMVLSHDIGGSGVRVFPNDFHKDVPQEQTIAQIAKALNEVGAFATDYGQQVRLECHGRAGYLWSIRAIMDQVNQPSVRVKLNSSSRDTEGEGFEHNFNLVKKLLGDTLHLHDLTSEDFPYQQQMNLLVKMGWTGWQLLEVSSKVPDRLKALIEMREIWDGLLDNALKA